MITEEHGEGDPFVREGVVIQQVLTKGVMVVNRSSWGSNPGGEQDLWKELFSIA